MTPRARKNVPAGERQRASVTFAGLTFEVQSPTEDQVLVLSRVAEKVKRHVEVHDLALAAEFVASLVLDHEAWSELEYRWIRAEDPTQGLGDLVVLIAETFGQSIKAPTTGPTPTKRAVRALR
jgi:hypothetical protein